MINLGHASRLAVRGRAQCSKGFNALKVTTLRHSQTTRIAASSSAVASFAAISGQQEYFRSGSTSNSVWSPSAVLMLASGATLLTSLYAQDRKVDCCGIAGVIATPNHDARYVRFGSHDTEAVDSRIGNFIVM